MDVSKRFKALNLHSGPPNEEDLDTKPFLQTARIQEDHKQPVYGCSFNFYVEDGEIQTVATVGGKFIHLYEVPRSENQLKLIGSCHLPTDFSSNSKNDREENLFTVTWCLDTFELKNGENPYRIVAAGSLGHIYVIDSVSRRLVNRLRSIGGEINDLRTSPVNSNLVACASSDQSVRIHHIRNEACLIVIGGLQCHSGTILSVDWSTNGDYLLSCGFDHQIMRWDLDSKEVKNHLESACKALETGEINVLLQTREFPRKNEPEKALDLSDDSAKSVGKINTFLRDKLWEIGRKDSCMLPIYNPTGVSSDLHDEYVDCVRIVPGTQFVFSKGCGGEKSIILWRFGPPKGEIRREPDALFSAETCTTKLATLHVPNGEPWFIKFAIDPRRRWLASGGIGGAVNFFDLRTLTDQQPTVTVTAGNETVRQSSFSTCGRLLVVVGDGGMVSRFDRVPNSVDKKNLAKF